MSWRAFPQVLCGVSTVCACIYVSAMETDVDVAVVSSLSWPGQQITDPLQPPRDTVNYLTSEDE